MAGDPAGWVEVLTSWSPAPVADGLLLLACVVYVASTTHVYRAGGQRHPWRSVSWAAAMATIVLAVNGPVGTYSEVLFWVHMVQHLMLIMVAPLLLIWARPVHLFRAAAGERLPTRWRDRSAPRRLTGPVPALAAYTAVVVLTHLTGFQQVSATHPWVRAFELALYLGSGIWFLSPLVGLRPGLPYLLRFAVLGLGMGADTLTGVTLMLTGHALAPVYAGAHPGWGPDVLADQQLAGAIMWFGGDLLMMLLMIVTAVRWSRADADQQGLGRWLEGARRQAVLGPGKDEGVDVDSDQHALDEYNATLAALHGRAAPARPEHPAQTRPSDES